MGFPGVSLVKNLPASAGDAGDMGSNPGSGRFPGEGNGYPLQYSCLGNPTDRGAWWTTVDGVAESQTGLHLSCTKVKNLEDTLSFGKSRLFSKQTHSVSLIYFISPQIRKAGGEGDDRR